MFYKLILFYFWIIFLLINADENLIKKLALQWAPLVHMAPDEIYYPSSVSSFLEHVIPIKLSSKLREESQQSLPQGNGSEFWHLTTKENIHALLTNVTSFLHGQNPETYSVPVYVSIVICRGHKRRENNTLDNNIEKGPQLRELPHFYVTYWMFYPFNKGKSMCTLDMGRLGAWPIPKVNNFCWGAVKDFGSHIGDWEHFSVLFQDSVVPKKMYISAHDVGAVYKYSEDSGSFIYDRRHIRKGILQRPNFPPEVKLSSHNTHPILFASKGSHGLWSAPGRHKFVRMPRLHDDTGYGSVWKTWLNLRFLDREDGEWLMYRGRWGNPRSRCHPVSNFGVHLCELVDGPTGIPTKKSYFQCS